MRGSVSMFQHSVLSLPLFVCEFLQIDRSNDDRDRYPDPELREIGADSLHGHLLLHLMDLRAGRALHVWSGYARVCRRDDRISELL